MHCSFKETKQKNNRNRMNHSGDRNLEEKTKNNKRKYSKLGTELHR